MANREIPRELVNSKAIRSYMKANKLTFMKLAELTGYSEKTIRRGLSDGKMSPWLIDLIVEKTTLKREEIVIQS